MVTIMRPITVGNSGISSYSQYDDVNKTIVDMGGDTISTNANRWCSCRYGSDGMWVCNSNGYLSNNGFYGGLAVVPVCSLIIP